jgi:SnoaL-like domain
LREGRQGDLASFYCEETSDSRDAQKLHAMTSTKEVIERHLRSFHDGDIERILEDYSPDAILFTPERLLKGRHDIRTLFQTLLADFAKPGGSDTLRTAMFEGDYAYIVWSAETADHVYELATDTFVVRDGKIVVQSFAAKLSPKH